MQAHHTLQQWSDGFKHLYLFDYWRCEASCADVRQPVLYCTFSEGCSVYNMQENLKPGPAWKIGFCRLQIRIVQLHFPEFKHNIKIKRLDFSSEIDLFEF